MLKQASVRGYVLSVCTCVTLAGSSGAVPRFDFHSNFWVNLHQVLLHEALLRAMQAWRLELPRDPKAWLLTTAKHLAIDRNRRDRRLELAEREPPGRNES